MLLLGSICVLFSYIYIFFAFALNESVILDAPQFPTQNIYQSRDLSRANGRNNAIASQ